MKKFFATAAMFCMAVFIPRAAHGADCSGRQDAPPVLGCPQKPGVPVTYAPGASHDRIQLDCSIPREVPVAGCPMTSTSSTAVVSSNPPHLVRRPTMDDAHVSRTQDTGAVDQPVVLTPQGFINWDLLRQNRPW